MFSYISIKISKSKNFSPLLYFKLFLSNPNPLKFIFHRLYFEINLFTLAFVLRTSSSLCSSSVSKFNLTNLVVFSEYKLVNMQSKICLVSPQFAQKLVKIFLSNHTKLNSSFYQISNLYRITHVWAELSLDTFLESLQLHSASIHEVQKKSDQFMSSLINVLLLKKVVV